MLARLQHPNLVRLLGVCDEGHHRMCVTEYMHRGSLRTRLDDTTMPLSWHERLQVGGCSGEHVVIGGGVSAHTWYIQHVCTMFLNLCVHSSIALVHVYRYKQCAIHRLPWMLQEGWHTCMNNVSHQ